MKNNVLAFVINSIIFLLALVGLILLRVYVTETPPPPDAPTHKELEDFMKTIDADFYFYTPTANRTYLYTAFSITPTIVVQPKSEIAIEKIIAFVRRYTAFPFSIKSGGHSAAGYCLNDNGLVLDLSKNFNNVSWGDEEHSSVVIEGGAVWDTVYKFLSGSGKGVTGPLCPTVGVAAFLMGGGMNRYSYLNGLGIDNVLEFNLILANDSKVVASETTNPDLFWALRGGGGGNFGVVISIKLKTFDVGFWSNVEVCWGDITEIPAVLDLWGPDIREPLADRYYSFEIYRTPIDIGFCIFVQQYNTTVNELVEYLSPYIARYDDIYYSNFTDIQIPVPIETFPNDYQLAKSLVLDTTAFNSQMNTVLRNALTTMRDIYSLSIIYENFGRQANSISSTATAFPHRSFSGVLHVKAYWPKLYDAILGDAARDEANDFFSQLTAWNYGAYINYIDPFLTNWATYYYSDNFERLRSIQSAVDPNSFFKFPQSIADHY